MLQHLINYVLVINTVTLVLAMLDRFLTARRIWRLPEKPMLILAWMGGALGAKLAQSLLGHKRGKLDYSVSLNLILFFQAALIVAGGSYQLTTKAEGEKLTTLETWMGKDDKPARPKRFGPGTKK